MLSDRPCATMLPASDIERAKSWFADTLDLKPVRETPGGTDYECADGTRFSIYPSEFAGTNQATVMGWLTPDINADMEELRSRGVTFEEYDLPGIKTAGGIARLDSGEQAAWFKDSEGNILSLFQEAPR